MSTNVAAAVEVARRLGLHVGTPVLLRDLGTTLVRLDPHPVVARVWPTGTRPAAVVEHELMVTSYLVAHGAPVGAPYGDPMTHEVDDRTVTVWALVDHDDDRLLDARAAGRALRIVHDLLGAPTAPDLPGLPHYLRLEESTEVVRALDVPAEDRRDLEELLARAAASADELDHLGLPFQPLHGDAWLGNVLRTPKGPVWSDFELVCRGPREVDLATNQAVATVRGPTPADEELLEGYGDVDRRLVDTLLPLTLVPFTAWSFRLAGDRPEHLPPARARLALALERLRATG